MKKNTYLIVGIAAIAAYFIFFRKATNPNAPAQTSLNNLIAWATANAQPAERDQAIQQFRLMSTDEQNDSWNYLQLTLSGAAIPADLRQRIDIIASKYNVFS